MSDAARAAALAPTSFAIPTLETARLVMRAFTLADIEEEVAFFATERSRFVGGPLERAQAWRSVASYMGHWALRGFGFWALEEKATGRYAGRAGLWYPDGWPEPEIGWTLMAHSEGRGLAFEAASAARRFAYDTLGWSTVISLILASNRRSEALARRMGAACEGTFEHAQYGPCSIWRHPAPEPKGATP